MPFFLRPLFVAALSIHFLHLGSWTGYLQGHLTYLPLRTAKINGEQILTKIDIADFLAVQRNHRRKIIDIDIELKDFKINGSSASRQKGP